MPSGRGRDFGDEVAIGAQGTAQQRGQTLDVAGFGTIPSVRKRSLISRMS